MVANYRPRIIHNSPPSSRAPCRHIDIFAWKAGTRAELRIKTAFVRKGIAPESEVGSKHKPWRDERAGRENDRICGLLDRDPCVLWIVQ
jgi:hypothetical protein